MGVKDERRKKEIEFDYKSFCLTNAAELQKALVSNGMGEGRGEGRGKVGIWHTDAIAKLESFRALKLSRLESFKVLKFTARLESFRALKFSNFERFSALKVTRLVSFRVLRITARLECFRALKLSKSESFRAIKLQIVSDWPTEPREYKYIINVH